MRALLLIALALGLLLGFAGSGVFIVNKKLDEMKTDTKTELTDRIEHTLDRQRREMEREAPEMNEVFEMVQKRNSKEINELFEKLREQE